MNLKKNIIAVLIVGGSLFHQLHATPTVTFYNIPVGGTAEIVNGISPDGKYIVGSCDSYSSEINQGFSYNTETDSLKFWGNGSLRKVNNNGMIVGDLVNESINALAAGYAVSPDSGFTFIPGDANWLPGAYFFSAAYDLTPDGSMIVGEINHPDDTFQAFTWTAAQGTVGLPGSAPGYCSSAYGVSEDGSVVVGWQQTPSLFRCASIWKNGVQTVFDNAEGEFYCVSSDGKTAAGNYNGKLGIWTEAGGMTSPEGLAWSNFVAMSDSGVIVGTSDDGGIIWTAETGVLNFKEYLISLGAVIPDYVDLREVKDITADGQTFAGWGVAGAWYLKISNGVDITTDTQQPIKAVLTRNYPNPFNPNTIINFNLLQTADVKLQITNSNGQLVKEAALGSLNNGSHQYDFNGENLNSGIYFCSIIVNGIKAGSHKMVLAK